MLELQNEKRAVLIYKTQKSAPAAGLSFIVQDPEQQKKTNGNSNINNLNELINNLPSGIIDQSNPRSFLSKYLNNNKNKKSTRISSIPEVAHYLRFTFRKIKNLLI